MKGFVGQRWKSQGKQLQTREGREQGGGKRQLLWTFGIFGDEMSILKCAVYNRDDKLGARQ